MALILHARSVPTYTGMFSMKVPLSEGKIYEVDAFMRAMTAGASRKTLF